MRRISRCLNEKLTVLCQQSIKLEELSQKVNEHLSEPLHGQCQVGSFNKGCLTLITSNAEWASQLRYALPSLRDSLRQAGIYQLTSIKITVASNETALIKKPSVKNHVSEKSRLAILQSAEACHYKPLRDALHRLANKSESL